MVSKLIAIYLLTISFPLFADIDESMLELKKDLKSKMLQTLGKGRFKIAVVNFKEIGEESTKAKSGEIVSSNLSKHFINDSDFIVVERNRMDKILEELRLVFQSIFF